MSTVTITSRCLLLPPEYPPFLPYLQSSKKAWVEPVEHIALEADKYYYCTIFDGSHRFEFVIQVMTHKQPFYKKAKRRQLLNVLYGDIPGYVGDHKLVSVNIDLLFDHGLVVKEITQTEAMGWAL